MKSGKELNTPHFQHLIHHFYSGKWADFEIELDEAIADFPEDLRLHCLNCFPSCWLYFYGKGESYHARTFLKRSNDALDQIRSEPWEGLSPLVQQLTGALYGYRALILFRQWKPKEAGENGMKAYDLIKDQEDRDDPQSWLTKGIYLYMLGALPFGARLFINTFGLKGDKQEGYQYLEKAMEADHFISFDAAMVLASLYEREEKLELALRAVEKNVEREPHHPIYLYRSIIYAEKNGKKDKVRDYKERLKSNTDPRFAHLLQG